MASESELVAALAEALAPIAVAWGWNPFESAEKPASLPVVTVRRSLFSTAAYEDMCEAGEVQGDTTLLVHSWAAGYQDARELNAQVREVILGEGGWTLQTETDIYEPNFRAWQIEGQWFAGGVKPE